MSDSRHRQADDPVCAGCGDAIEPGDRVVQVEYGEQTPWDMETRLRSDDLEAASGRYHAGCVPTDLPDSP